MTRERPHGPHRTFDDVLSSADTPSRPEETRASTRQEDPARLSRRADLVAVLRGAPYPTDRDGLRRFLEEHAAPGSMVDALQVLPQGQVFEGPAAVATFLPEATHRLQG